MRRREREKIEREITRLMSLALDGDLCAYTEFLTKVRVCLMRYFQHKLKLLGHGLSAAEDLSQETLIGVHEARMRYDRSRPLMPWVLAIARYRLIHHLRSSKDLMKNNGYVAVPIDDVEIAIGHAGFGSIESRIDVEKLMATLSPKMQEAIRLVRIEEMSIAGAAWLSGQNYTTLKQQVSRGIRNLSETAMAMAV